MAFLRQWRELDGELLRRGSPFPVASRLLHSLASTLQAQLTFSVSATTSWKLLFQSEFRACTRVPPHVKPPPASWALVQFPHINVQRSASRFPGRRFPGGVLASSPRPAGRVQRSGLCPCARGGQGRAQKVNTSETRSLPSCCC